MLDFIKQQLGTELVQESKITDESISDTDNELIVEYAHLFQELDDSRAGLLYLPPLGR